MEVKKCHSCGAINPINTTRCKGCGWNLIGSRIYSAGESNSRRSGWKKLVLCCAIGVLMVAAVTGVLYLKRKRSHELEASLKTAIAQKGPLTVDIPKEIYRRSADPTHDKAQGLVVSGAARVLEKTGYITVDTLLTHRSTRLLGFGNCFRVAVGCDPGPSIPTGIPDAVYDIKVTLTPSGENLAKEWQYVEQTEYKDIVRAAYTGYLEPSQDDGSDVISGKWVVPIAERELVAISIPAYSFASDEFAVEFSRRWKVRPYVQGIECDKPDMDSHYADASTIIHTHKTYSGSAQIVRTNGKRETATVSFKED